MEPLKNLINKSLINLLSKEIENIDSSFNRKQFTKVVLSNLEALELKDRVRLVAYELHRAYGENVPRALGVFIKVVKSDKFKGFDLWPFSEYAGAYGSQNNKYHKQSLELLVEVTKRFTAEFGIRSFLINDWDKTIVEVKKWIKSENEHLRRLSSEGTRPLLPWGEKLKSVEVDIEKTWWILEELKNDPSEYVRKSVANHINDHSKKFPDIVVARLNKWDLKNPQEMWIIKHGLRTLIKKAHPKALSLVGVNQTNVEILDFNLMDKEVKIGESLRVSVRIQNSSTKKIKVLIDTEVHLLKKNGTHNIKCFKGKVVELKPKENIIVNINIPFKLVTTRSYYDGVHHINCLVNGKKSSVKSFKLLT